LVKEADKAALDFIRNKKSLEHKRCAELYKRRSGLNLGERGFCAVDATNTD